MEYKVTALGKGLAALLIFALGYGVYLALVPRADTPPAKPPAAVAMQGATPAAPAAGTPAVPAGTREQQSAVPAASVEAAAAPVAAVAQGTETAQSASAAVAGAAVNKTAPAGPGEGDPAARAAIEACARMATDYRLTIYYAPHTSEIGKEFMPELKEFADNAKLLHGYRVQVEGSCAVMPEQKVSAKQQLYYQTLSEKRAQVVAQYLSSQGLAAEILDVRGKGIASQIGDNSTSQLRFHNRRTDIFLLPQQ